MVWCSRMRRPFASPLAQVPQPHLFPSRHQPCVVLISHALGWQVLILVQGNNDLG